MLDWKSPEVIAVCASVFNYQLIFVLGMYGWQWLLTLHDVEIRLILRQLKFKWAYLPYLGSRYSLWTLLLGLMYAKRTHQRINCQATYTFLSVIGNICMVCASTNLLIRTIAIWKSNKWVRLLLILSSLGHWMIALQGAFTMLTAYWSDDLGGCFVQYHPRTMLEFYLYTELLDFAILVLTLVGLLRPGMNTSRSPLWTRVYKQGLWCFVVTFLIYIPILVMCVMDLNPVMVVFFSVPAVLLSTIASSAAVTSLFDLKTACEHSPNVNHAEKNNSTCWEARTSLSHGHRGVFTTNIDVLPISYADSYSFDLSPRDTSASASRSAFGTGTGMESSGSGLSVTESEIRFDGAGEIATGMRL